MAQGFGGLNLERDFDITHFEEILESLMHGGFMGFFSKICLNFWIWEFNTNALKGVFLHRMKFRKAVSEETYIL
jgi:hypothetical protein